MKRKTIIILFCVTFLLNMQGTGESLSGQTNAYGHTVSSYTQHDPIVITHNDNYTQQGWSGSGTSVDPFVISGLEITQDTDPAISITDTDVYVTIQDCLLRRLNHGRVIFLESVENIVIEDCLLEGGITAENGEHLTVDGCIFSHSGISVIRNDYTEILDNVLVQGTIYFADTEHNSIIGNRVFNSTRGIDLAATGDFDIHNNTVVGHDDYGLGIRSINVMIPTTHTLYWNRLGWNGQNAKDERGNHPHWDSSERGNFWSDYDGEGDYIIPSGEAIDRYPSVLVDEVGPMMTMSQMIMTPSEDKPMSVSITDESGVKNATLSWSVDGGSTWQNKSLTFDWDDWVATLQGQPAGSIISVKVHALDCAGNWATSTTQTVDVTSEATGTTTPTVNGIPIEPSMIMPIGILGAIVVVALIAVVMKRR